MTTLLKNILKGDSKEKIDGEILELKTQVHDADFISIARPTSVKEYSKWSDNTHQPFNFKKLKTPAHVKAAITYNDYLRYKELDRKYAYIGNGEKIKWLYLTVNNPYRLETMAFKDNDEDPKEVLEYIEKYADREKVFDSEMEKKLQDFYTALKWGNIPTKVYQEHAKFF